jgi:hypothetical protein
MILQAEPRSKLQDILQSLEEKARLAMQLEETERRIRDQLDALGDSLNTAKQLT